MGKVRVTGFDERKQTSCAGLQRVLAHWPSSKQTQMAIVHVLKNPNQYVVVISSQKIYRFEISLHNHILPVNIVNSIWKHTEHMISLHCVFFFWRKKRGNGGSAIISSHSRFLRGLVTTKVWRSIFHFLHSILFHSLFNALSWTQHSTKTYRSLCAIAVTSQRWWRCFLRNLLHGSSISFVPYSL